MLSLADGIRVIKNQAMEGGAGGIPGGPECFEPLRVVEPSRIGWKRDRSAGQQRGKNHYVQTVRIKDRTHAEAPIMRGQIEPTLHPRRGSQHVLVGGGN